jgi:glycosyltransferase involved in cell wall biosynthesis
MMLYKLLSRCDRARFRPTVVSLTNVGPVGERIAELGVRVIPLRIKGPFSAATGLVRLARLLRAIRADVVQTWMYHADLLGGLAAGLGGKIAVIWGIRQSTFDPQASKRTTRWVARSCARLSRWLPTAIIACSDRARLVHMDLGYPPSIEVIPNGFDLQLFTPDRKAGRQLRAELGLPADAVLVGLVARLDPQKDHRTFIEAAGQVAAQHPDVHFVLCGPGVTGASTELSTWINGAGIREKCHLLGPRSDMPSITAGLDIAVSSSAWGEGFSNTIGEAMACGIPCVVTDIGDSADIVGDSGRVVAPRQPRALAAAIEEMIAIGTTGRARLGESGRRRMVERYELGQIVRRYEQRYQEMVNDVWHRRTV